MHGDNNITGTNPGDTHITSDMCTGIIISQGHIRGDTHITSDKYTGIIISRGHIPGIHISLVICARGYTGPGLDLHND